MKKAFYLFIATVRPVAVLAFTENGVEVLQVPDKKGKIDQLIERIPGWVDKFQRKTGDH